MKTGRQSTFATLCHLDGKNKTNKGEKLATPRFMSAAVISCYGYIELSLESFAIPIHATNTWSWSARFGYSHAEPCHNVTFSMWKKQRVVPPVKQRWKEAKRTSNSGVVSLNMFCPIWEKRLRFGRLPFFLCLKCTHLTHYVIEQILGVSH